MKASSRVRRRDARYRLKLEDASLELRLAGNGRTRARLIDLSAAGLAIDVPEGAAPPKAGDVIPDAAVKVGNCRIRGTVRIQSVFLSAPEQTRCGCFFYPDTPQFEVALMALLAGLASSAGEPPDRPKETATE